jgi:mannose-1-phosphate guanylyltransferase/phosphomannomutase
LPDAGEPLVHIYANSEDRHWVDHQLRYYQAQVLQFIADAQEESYQHFS